MRHGVSIAWEVSIRPGAEVQAQESAGCGALSLACNWQGTSSWRDLHLGYGCEAPCTKNPLGHIVILK